MSVLIAIALKSLLIGGLTLGLLHLMRKRSAAERSWVAHVGLLALLIMAFAPLVLPSWKVEAPTILGQSKAPAVVAPKTMALSTAPVAAAALPEPSRPVAVSPSAPQPSGLSIDASPAATAMYAVPAVILLLITFLALARLVALQARAEVLVDGHWLSALARAQRRMGFKHGTALLTSDELASPISWGLMRPVILLNSRAVEAADEAEAIIAHELAHVARLDWVKLLLARVATALFWFNPLVWLLAREAHQLREETADDTVLAADIADTDYAQLLVGVARHECPGLLLGAHGVAPSKSSLARRIARVLDGRSVRGPAARGFALGVLAGATLVAAPLAALTITPAASPPVKQSASWSSPAAAHQNVAAVEAVQADLPHIIARGVSTSVATAMAAVAPAPKPARRLVSKDGASVSDLNGTTVTRRANGSTVTIYPPDAQGRRKIVAQSANGSSAVSYIDRDNRAVAMAEPGDSRNHEVKVLIEAKALSLTPEFISEIRAAAPELSDASLHQISGLRALGVTPEFVRSIASAGFPMMDAHDLMGARAVGLSAGYIKAMRSAGVEGDLDDFVQLRAVGVDPGFAARVRASGIQHLDADTLVQMSALGMSRQAPLNRMKIHMKMKHERASSDDAADTPDANLDADPNPDG